LQTRRLADPFEPLNNSPAQLPLRYSHAIRLLASKQASTESVQKRVLFHVIAQAPFRQGKVIVVS